MKLESKDIVNQPLAAIYPLMRDELPKLVPYLPNVDKIVQVERKDSAAGPAIVNQWFAKVSIPSVVAKFLKPEFMSWKDIAQWNDSGSYVDYRLESDIAKGLFEVKGRNSFISVSPTQTEIRVECDVQIYPEKLPGVPRLLAGTIKGPVEELIKKILEPNLTSLSKGVQAYFKNQK